MEVTYICAQTKEQVKSSDGLPEGWIVPKEDLSMSNENFSSDPFPKYTVLAISSPAALKQYKKARLEKMMQNAAE